MEPRTSEEIAQYMQPLLRKYEGDDGLIISSAEDEPGAQLGDNYMSVVLRTKIVGKHKDGKPYKKIFITKCFPHHRPSVAILKTKSVFENEAYTYEKILPILGDFAPRCIHADCDYIVLEDMKERGYTTCDKKQFLSYDHAVLALRTLAKYHANSLAIKLKDPAAFEKLIAPLTDMAYDNTQSNPFKVWSNMTTTIILRHIGAIEPQDEEIKKITEYLKSIENNTFEKLMEPYHQPRHKYHALCHGDTWTNNMLFKHDSNGKPIDVKFIDYQIGRHGPTVLDFHYLVYTSVRTSVFEERYDDLVVEYFDQLKKQLREHNVPDKDHEDLTLDWLRKELKTYRLHGLIFGCELTVVVLAEGNNIINMDEMSEQDMFDTDRWMKSAVQMNMAERMKAIAVHYWRTYCQ